MLGGFPPLQKKPYYTPLLKAHQLMLCTPWDWGVWLSVEQHKSLTYNDMSRFPQLDDVDSSERPDGDLVLVVAVPNPQRLDHVVLGLQVHSVPLL